MPIFGLVSDLMHLSQRLKRQITDILCLSRFPQRQCTIMMHEKGPTGGNEFLELGYLRPDIILKDLVKISHPTVLARP